MPHFRGLQGVRGKNMAYIRCLANAVIEIKGLKQPLTSRGFQGASSLLVHSSPRGGVVVSVSQKRGLRSEQWREEPKPLALAGWGKSGRLANPRRKALWGGCDWGQSFLCQHKQVTLPPFGSDKSPALIPWAGPGSKGWGGALRSQSPPQWTGP